METFTGIMKDRKDLIEWLQSLEPEITIWRGGDGSLVAASSHEWGPEHEGTEYTADGSAADWLAALEE